MVVFDLDLLVRLAVGADRVDLEGQVCLVPSASVTVLRSTAMVRSTCHTLFASCLKVGPADGFLPETGRLPAWVNDSGPAAGLDDGGA
ncbi:hypothetical protein DNK48_00085 [Streptomyces malaysiensis subsp. malaysiensis]|nr:hypothetical protein DNK48_00085 [Streptomyces malaysiensis]